MPEITALNIYPVKSLRGIAVDQAEFCNRGFRYDRHWMVTGPDYHFITQRQIPKMASIRVTIDAGQLAFYHEGREPLTVHLDKQYSDTVKTKVWKDVCDAFDEGETAAAWLAAVLGNRKMKSFRLVRFANEFKRQVEPDYLQGEEAYTAFSDGYPYLLTSADSLTALNEKLIANGSDAVTMDRFRPNIVISGLEPFLEDGISTIQDAADSYKLSLCKPCQRCKITTVDQADGRVHNPKEPLYTLSKMDRFAGKKGAFFGQNAVLSKGAGNSASVGDQLIIMQSR